MGRQISFYMAGDDEQRFLDELRAIDDVVVVLEQGTSPEPSVLAELPENVFVGLVLWNRTLKPGLGFESLGTYFSLDKFNEPVIEFHRTSIRHGLFQPGRLWYQSRPDEPTYDAATARALSRWYDRCLKVIKANSEAIGPRSSREYLWPGAKRMLGSGAVKLGYEFIPGP